MNSKSRSWMTIVLAAAVVPAMAQNDIKAAFVKHLKTSKDFTLKVADQMPEASYDFKLTPPQMSFAQQIVHLAQSLDEFLSPLTGERPNPGKPASLNKKDVMAFAQQSFDRAIERVNKLTMEQISKSYKSEEGMMTGLEYLMIMMDHTTHHRASAEMYLRAKGIKPTEYEF